MKTNEVTKGEIEITSIKLNNVDHKPSKASKLIVNLINKEKLLYKTQKFKIMRINHNYITDVIDNRIKKLQINSIIKISQLNTNAA